MILRYTPEARQDLRAIKTYISDVLQNPIAARSYTNRIVTGLNVLKEQPNAGMSLAAKTGRATPWRYWIVGEHIAFYHVNQNTITILRILDGRTDYLRMLFRTET